MPHPLVSWLMGDDGQTSIVADLRSGRAGILVRAGFSVAAAAASMAPVMLVLGALEATGQNTQDHHVSMGIMCAALAWGAALIWIWWGHRRGRHIVRTVILIMAIWPLAIATAITLEEIVGGSAEYLIAGVLLMAAAATLTFIVVGVYHALTSDRSGWRGVHVSLKCPDCGYLLSGLESMTCPECGAGFTVDGILRAQGFVVDGEHPEEDETPELDAEPAPA